MTLAPGTKLGPYRIVESIGAGGMGEVYKSEDTRLGRTVAIKVLPAHLSDNAELRERFEREARAISSLNHPHICTVHDVGRENGVDFIVMELLEGETLADRLARRALSLDDALRYAVEIADALDQAHQNGVIHRDVKPGNIMLSPAGAKLFDFGLAKEERHDKVAEADSATPTQRRDLTSEGAVLGTLRYMAPEQLEGRDVDARTDIFAFGVVLYEMVTGKKAFDSRSQASLTAAILDSEPDSIATSTALDWIVRTAMAKDPDDRWRSMHDVKLELERLADVGDPDVARASRTSPSLAWAVAAVAIGALAVSLWTGATSPPRATRRFTIPPPAGAAFSWKDSPEISPDGSLLALVAEDATGIQHLWIRPLDNLEARALPGTEGARQPFWAPDGHSLGFFAGGHLKKIEINGTAPETLAPATDPHGGAWSSDGTIVFTPRNGGLFAVPHTGGDPRPVSVPDADQDELLHRFPVFLPDGRQFLFVVQAVGPENSGLFVGTVDSEEKQRVGSFPSRAIFALPGHLLYRGESALMAQRFDLDRLELVGDPFAVDEGVAGARTFGGALFSVSENGVVVFRPQTTSLSRLVWFDREGNTLRSIGESAEYNGLDLADDGTRILVELLAPETRMGDVWLLDDSRNTATRITYDLDWEFGVGWSRDGSANFLRHASRNPSPLVDDGGEGNL